MKKDDATYSDTPIEISGREEAVNVAKKLIEEIVDPGLSVENGNTPERLVK